MQTTILPQIALVDNNWVGDNNLINFLEETSSLLGILNDELFHKVLKEYNLYRDVYDLSHNRNTLIKCRSISLAKECNQYSDSESAHFTKLLVEISPSMFPKRYPILPLEFINDMAGQDNSVLDQLSPYLDLGEFDLTYFKQKLRKHFMVIYYADWRDNIINPYPWFNTCINAIKSLDNTNPEAFKNTLDRRLINLSKGNDPATYILSKLGDDKHWRIKNNWLISLWHKLRS